MSETPQTPNHDLKQSLKEKILIQLGWIDEVVNAIGGEEGKLETVLPAPPAVRNEAPMPNWSTQQQAQIREIAQRFGYGAENDVQSGLPNVVCIAEGGKVWKIMAEAEALKKELGPRLIFSGSRNRKLGQDELDFIKEKFGQDWAPETSEYDAARWVAIQQISGTPEPVVLSFGYGIEEGNPVIQEQTGQLIRLGLTESGQSIEIFRVDRQDYVDEAGADKYRWQPDNLRIMGIVSEFLAIEGDQISPVALATSNTYASRQVNAIRAGLEHGREFGVTMYGRQTIKNLGAPVPGETPLNHLPGDLRITHDSLRKLLDDLQD